MRNSPFWWILISVMVLVDIYCFQAIKTVSHSATSRTKTIIYTVYWILSASAIILLIVLPYLNFQHQSKFLRTTIFALIAGIFLAKLLASVFFLIDDIRRGVQWIVQKFSGSASDPVTTTSKGISRSVFLSWTGMAFGTGLFGSLIYGFGNKYKYQVKKYQLAYDNLPSAFKGLKIVHISDIHSGSFTNKEAVTRGVEKIMKERPDIILFTGDLVNDIAPEMKDYMEVFNKLSAPMGVYSVLGNHDYGDYFSWDTPEEKKANLEALKEVHRNLGWRLLMDEHVALKRDDQEIALLGVQNISGRNNFHSYGDLGKAHTGAEKYPFKILMSHDPSHWDSEVTAQYQGIDLMLSGHTHGFQFGVELPGFRWSPVQYVYRQWAGLYEKGKQKLYINRGYGFIGYPGRVGILPEITVLELV